MCMRGDAWNPKEDEYMKETYPTYIPIDEIKEHLEDRSISAIYARARKLKLERPYFVKYPKIENIHEVDWKIHFYKKNTLLSDAEIGDKLGLSKTQVKRRVTKEALHLRPPVGEPPLWFNEAVRDEGVLI